MSKKFNLSISSNARSDLPSLFKSWVQRRIKEEKEKRSYHTRYCLYDDDDDDYYDGMEQLRRFYGDCFPMSSYLNDHWDEYDDYYVGDDGEIIFPPKKDPDLETTLRPEDEGLKKKHRKHRGKKKAKIVDISEPYYAGHIDNNGDALEDCSIYFYEDYHDKYSKIEFNNLYEFDKYCQEMGFLVPSYVAEEIAYSPVSHCCINPAAKERGSFNIMREETYGDLFYEACESQELSNT